MEEKVFSINPSFEKSLDLETEGWKKLSILYSTEWISNASYLCWKIKDTEHVFRIPTTIVYENHGLDYSEHFSLTLKVFRDDFLEWKRAEFPEPWMKKYQKIFSNLIMDL